MNFFMSGFVNIIVFCFSMCYLTNINLSKGKFMNKIILAILTVTMSLCIFSESCAANRRRINPKAKQFKYSTTIEKERPELNEETKRLIAAYRKNPTDANYQALRKQAEINYAKVVERKKAKLEELRQTARDAYKVEEMQVIVEEMLRDRENRINQTMGRFTDPRLRPNARKTTDGYLPVLGAAQNVSIAYTPVTNAEFNAFLRATGKKVITEDNKLPVINISYNTAIAYTKWLSDNDKTAIYRLPTEAEWELAAGHMPKDADMNCGEGNGLTPVDTYKQTLSAVGAIDMWGNVWEWTSTDIVATQGKEKGQNVKAIKGGSWYSHRTSCRTEYRGEGRNPDFGYETVGFRVIREK